MGKILFVTGKGGVGKTTVAAALAQRAAAHGVRTLVVETASDGRLAAIFGGDLSGTEVQTIGERLDAVRISPRQLVEEYFTSLLRLSFLSRRLFASSSFNALTTAAPGITEFLLLDKIREWAEPTRLRRPRYDLIVVDGPATGHAVKLLRTPRNLLAMVPVGPLATTARALAEMITNPSRSRAVLVSVAEEFSVRETVETHEALAALSVASARPVVNLVFPRRFSGPEIQQIGAATEDGAAVAAARFAIARRREAERNVRWLKRQTGATPVLLPQVFAPHIDHDELARWGRPLQRAVLAPAEIIPTEQR